MLRQREASTEAVFGANKQPELETVDYKARAAPPAVAAAFFAPK